MDRSSGKVPSFVNPRLWNGFSFVVLAVLFAALTSWSWRKWPDISVDYGLQLYTPWQLSAGKVLYLDVKYLAGGPLSQYFHALIFKCFGVSFITLIVTNLVLLALFVCLLYRLFDGAANRGTAMAVCLAVLCVFSFSQLGRVANYNFVCPYTYEATHGLFLSICALACLYRWISSEQNAWTFVAGLCFGAVFLTKPELFLALSATLGAAVWVWQTNSTLSCSQRIRPMLLLLLGSIIPVGAFTLYLSMAWEPVEALKAVTGSWLPLLTTSAAHNEFYKWCLGLDRPYENVILIARHSAIVLSTVAFLALCARFFHRRNYALNAGLGIGLLFLIYEATAKYPWLQIGSAFGPLALAGCVFVAWKFWKTRHSAESSQFYFPLLWSVFALFLLAKMGLATRIWHYGFYLAMPATGFLIFLVAWILPRELERFDVNPTMFRALAGIIAIAGLINLFGISDLYYQAKNLAVADGGDRIYAYNRRVNEIGYSIDQTVARFRTNTPPSATVALLPEGVMVNYLARRSNPTPYAGFTLPEVQACGERKMVAAYAQSRPDYIVLMHRDSSEYGVGYFGSDRCYGYEMMHWVRTNYSSVWLIGCEPLQTPAFGMKLLKRTEL
jgi:hypothetical protein